LARREQALIAKSELLAGRLGEETSTSSSSARGSRPEADQRTPKKGKQSAPVTDVELDREALKMKQLRQKKERLSFAVERLTLQAQQKERQLRMSMAAPQ
jgi:DASH complex subunit SPC19